MILMSPETFYSHYGLDTDPPATHLCYEVYDQGRRIASGHLTNTEEAHAEEVFLGERFRDAWKQCTIVWYISWSPCDRCLQILLDTFLPHNPHVRLQIIFAKVYSRTPKTMVKELNRRGVKIQVMHCKNFDWCWNHFVKNTGPFIPWQNMDRNYDNASQWLHDALSSGLQRTQKGPVYLPKPRGNGKATMMLSSSYPHFVSQPCIPTSYPVLKSHPHIPSSYPILPSNLVAHPHIPTLHPNFIPQTSHPTLYPVLIFPAHIPTSYPVPRTNSAVRRPAGNLAGYSKILGNLRSLRVT